jgi:hypothetical protein
MIFAERKSKSSIKNNQPASGGVLAHTSAQHHCWRSKEKGQPRCVRTNKVAHRNVLRAIPLFSQKLCCEIAQTGQVIIIDSQRGGELKIGVDNFERRKMSTTSI